MPKANQNTKAWNNGKSLDYTNFSIVMSGDKEKRAPLFVAFNINQNRIWKTERTDDWGFDSQIPEEWQIGERYYETTPWHRGHMVPRAAAGQYTDQTVEESDAEKEKEAQSNADATFIFSNACLQHGKLNSDEWEGIEHWVRHFNLAKDGRVSVFTGPIYGQYDRSRKPGRYRRVIVPGAFFKIVCFINKDTNNLEVRAFILYQDIDAFPKKREEILNKFGHLDHIDTTKDYRGKSLYNSQLYQTTIAEIEALSGLVFDPDIKDRNPLFFTPQEASDDPTIQDGFENIEITSIQDVIDDNATRRPFILDDQEPIYIAAANVAPQNRASGREWISIINLGAEEIRLDGWFLEYKHKKQKPDDDPILHALDHNEILAPGASIVIPLKRPFTLRNSGGAILLFDGNGHRIDRVTYTQPMVEENPLLRFLSPRDILK